MENKRFKYPRTPHLPWSPGGTQDDVHTRSMDFFIGKEVVVTEKMDGENTTMYSDHIHARSVDSRHHPSRDWVKRLHAHIKHNIPSQWRLCGENVYAKHSVHYASLASYFLLFSVWDQRNMCLSWEETIEWTELLGLTPPAILYQGTYKQDWFDSTVIDTERCEGYVLRLASEFHYDQFAESTAKWVRESHVKSDKHWMHKAIEPNQLGDQSVENKGS